MPNDVTARLPKLLIDLNKEIAQLLQANSLSDVTSYGWIDHDTPDPKYAGHAIWQTSPPFQPEWPALFNGDTVTHVPTEADEVLTLSGEDFIGTMMFARRSIGLALCYAGSVVSEPYYDSEEFWYEYTTSVQWLDIASDRLREFFMMAAFGRPNRKYKKSSGRGNQYSEPFRVALQQIDGPGKKYLTPLLPIATQIESHRLERHRIVHEVATKVAHTSIGVLKAQRELAKTGKPKQIEEVTFEQLQHPTGAHAVEDVVTAPLKVSREWYLDLIEASNLVFQFEYFERVGLIP